MATTTTEAHSIMYQNFVWAYQDWKTVDATGLAGIVGLPMGITAVEYKEITGTDYKAPTA